MDLVLLKKNTSFINNLLLWPSKNMVAAGKIHANDEKGSIQANDSRNNCLVACEGMSGY